MGSKRQRQADRALVAAYHEARLSELVERVAAAVDRFRAGELDAFDVDGMKLCAVGGRWVGVRGVA